MPSVSNLCLHFWDCAIVERLYQLITCFTCSRCMSIFKVLKFIVLILALNLFKQRYLDKLTVDLFVTYFDSN
jgi:hypothetical protein